MEKSKLTYGAAAKGRLLQLALLCLIGVLINRLGSLLAGVLPLPLYLDCLGTVLVASLGGFIPGILVGYLINLINGISDGASAFYGVLEAVAQAHPYEEPAIDVFRLEGKRINGGIGGVCTLLNERAHAHDSRSRFCPAIELNVARRPVL